MRLIKDFSICVFIALLSACGGGGGGSSVEPTPSPSPDSDYTLTKPKYSGTQEIAAIGAGQAANLSFDLAVSFDLLNSISFGDVYQRFFIVPDKSSNISSDENIICESGSAVVQEVNSKHIKVTYENCLQSGVLASGDLNLYLVRTNYSQIMDMDIIPDLTMKEVESGTFIKIEGYAQVRESNSNDYSHQATYQILLTNEANEQLYFNNFQTKVASIYERSGIHFSGEILSTEYGKLNIETTEFIEFSSGYATKLDVIAENSLKVEFVLGSKIRIDLDPTLIPLEIDLNNIPESFFDEENSAPVAQVTIESDIGERSNDFPLSAIDSTDSDLDLLSFQWSVIESPQGAVWSIDNSTSPNFSTDLPGNYTIELTVIDAQGVTSTATVEVYIAKSAPIFTVEEVGETVAINSLVKGKVTIENDHYDGPFEYEVIYGPHGMQVDGEGNLAWAANILDFGITTEVNYAIAVKNSDKVTTIENSLMIESSPERVQTELYRDMDAYVGSAKSQTYTDQNKEFIFNPLDNKFATRIYLNESNLLDVELIKDNLPSERILAASYDVTADRVLDHFIVKYDEELRLDTLWLENGATGEFTKVEGFDYSLSSIEGPGVFTFQDIDKDNELEIVIATHLNRGNLHRLHIYNMETLELENEIAEISGDVIGYCDLDNDGYKDMVTSDHVYSLNKNEYLVEGASLDEMRLLESSTGCVFVDKNSIYRFIDNELQAFEHKLMNSFAKDNPWFVGNFDGGTEEEVLVGHTYFVDMSFVTHWKIAKLNNDNTFSFTYLSLPNGGVVNGDDVIEVADIDGNGIDELIVMESSENLNRLSAKSLSGSQLIQKYSGVQYNSNFGHLSKLAKLEQDNSVTAYSTFGIHQFVKFGGDGTVKVGDFDGGAIKFTDVVDDELFYYVQAHSSSDFHKYTESMDILWSSTIDHSDDILDAGEYIIAFNTTSSTVYNKSDGTRIEYRVGELRSSPSRFNQQLFLDNEYRSIFELDESGELKTLVDIDSWEDKLEISWAAYLQFMQYDNDEQLEMVFTYIEDGAMVTEVVDGKTLAKEELSKGFNLGFDNSALEQQLAECFLGDLRCQNKILRTISPDNAIEVRDKITGKLIYRSPALPSRIRDIKFKYNENGKIDYALLTSLRAIVVH